MATAFTKLFNSILDSTVWCESNETRILWFTLLAMSDKDGVISAAVPGLANRARLTMEQTLDGLEKFMGPDKYSRTPDFEGRRIEPVDGGWRLLNHAKYRRLLSADERREYFRLKKREQRAKTDGKSLTANDQPANIVKDMSTMSTNVKDMSSESTHTEAEAEAEAEKRKQKTTLVAAQREKVASLPKKETTTAEIPIALRTPRFEAAWAEWNAYRKERRIAAYKPIGARKQLEKLVELGEDRAVAAIEFSIRQGYQGIYEENTSGGPLKKIVKSKPLVGTEAVDRQMNMSPLDNLFLARKRVIASAQGKLKTTLFHSLDTDESIIAEMIRQFPDFQLVKDLAAADVLVNMPAEIPS